MIFKTFDSDIDKISAKWGIFGKSFNDIGNAIVGRIKDINNGFQATDDLIGSFKDTDSIWKRLYPSKETIQSQMIDIDALYPEKTDAQFTKLLGTLTQQQSLIDKTKGSWTEYFNNLGEGEKWQIEFVQNTDLQKSSLDDVKKAYNAARDGAIAHNVALKQQTLSAKAGQVALKGLAMAGNMLAMWAISEAIELVVNGIDYLINFEKKASDAAQTVKEKSSQALSEDKETSETLDELIKKYKELRETSKYDENAKKNVLDIQDQITNLVGTQAKNLDLVNGKLDTQLEKLEKIKRKQANKTLDDAETDYYSTKDAANKLVGDGSTSGFLGTGLFSESGYDVIYDTDTLDFGLNIEEYEKLLKKFSDAGYGDIFLNKNGLKAKGNSAKEKENYLQGILDILRSERLTKNGLFTGISAAIKKYTTANDDVYKKAVSYANTWLSSSEEVDTSNITSIEDFEKRRKEIIDKLQNTQTISDAIGDKDFNKEDIEQIVDSYMSTCEDFSTWYEQWKNSLNDTSSDKTAISSQKTFDEVWNSIGEGDDDAGKKAQEAKEKVLELAEAGKLTEKAFEKSSIADTFTQAGYSIEKATKKINDMVSSADQLASMKSGISSISSILGEKKENLSNKKTKNDGIGADTLSGMPDDVKAQADEYENFVKVLGNGASTMQQCREAANNLATAYVNSYNFLSKLTPETVGYYTSVLKQMGVENASEVVTNALAKQTYALRLEKLANSNATKEEITALQEEASQYGITSTALANYVIQKRIANNNALDTSKSISNLIKLAKQCGATSNVVIALQNLLKSTSELESLYQKDLTDFSSNAATDLQHAPDAAANEKSEALGKASAKISASRKKLLKLIKDSTKIGASVKIKPTSPSNGSNGSKGSKGSKGSSKNTKTEINWLERRLTRMQSIIDLTASKLQNLFSVKAKNNNLDKQIKQTTKLMNQYKIAADRYMKKANSVAKSSGLSKDIIKKVKSGEITKASYSKLIKKYGQKKADKINSYIDYYDKAQDAKKNAEDQKTKKRELQVQKQTNIQEEADKKSARYQAERELAQLKNKNGWIKKEIDSTKESYNAQIKAAEIQKDTVEKDKLIAEKKKALLALYQEEIDNIKANAEARIQSLENGVINNNGTRKSYGQKYYQNQISLAEARGNKVNKDWYHQQSSIENKKISEYTAERNQLIKELAKFTEGTTEWYNLQADIQACDDSINEARIAQAENTKAMRELTEKMEQEYDDWFSNLNNEISFIASLKSGDKTDSDKGTFTDAGNLAMYSETFLFKSSNAEKEYWRNRTNKLQKLVDANASDEQVKLVDPEFNSLEEVKNALTSYRQNWQDAIKEEKQAEEEIINLMKEKYEAEKDYLQDIVDARKESLNLEKDLYDYERNIAEKTKNVATLQKRINSLRGDTSEEGRARLSKLQVELDSAQKDLQDTEYDRYISEQQNMLDNMMSQYEDLMTKLQKNTDKILADGFNYVNSNIGSLTTLLSETGAAYDYQMSTELSQINTSLANGVTTISSKFNTDSENISNILNGIKGDDNSSVVGLLQSMAGKVIEEYKKYETEKNSTPNNNGNNGGGGGEGSGSGFGASSSSNSTKQQTQTTNGQTTVTPDAMDKIEGTNAKLKKLRDALNSMKGAGFEKYWTKKNGTPKSYINQRIAAEPNYDKVTPDGKRTPQILTEAGLKLLAKKLGVKYPASSGAKTTNLNNYVKEAGFKTGGIAQLIKSNGEDGLMLARNGEGFVAPEHVQDIKELMKVIPDMNKFISSVTETPNIPIARNNQPSNSIGEVLFNIDVNPKDFPDFVSQLQNEKRVQQVFSVAVNDLTQKGKITNNIQRY